MAVTVDKPAPYAPPSAVLDIIERYRNRGLPQPINAEVLARAGVVTESLIPRTLQAIQVLDLIDKEGKPTPTFDGLRLAPEAEFKQRLADWIKAAYADVFAFVDPMTDDDTRIRDAFRSYTPIGQQDRMVTLFTGLCMKAGLMLERAQQQAARQPPPPTAIRQRVPGGNKFRTMKMTLPGNSTNATSTGNVPAPLAGLLATLPSPENGWTRAKRDSFMAAFGTVLDFCVPIVQATMEAAKKENGGT